MPDLPPESPAYPPEDQRCYQRLIDERMARVPAPGNYIPGDEGAGFEDEFAAYTQTRHCIGVASGTDALEIILRALEIGPGSKVAYPSGEAIVYTARAVRAFGEETT